MTETLPPDQPTEPTSPEPKAHESSPQAPAEGPADVEVLKEQLELKSRESAALYRYLDQLKLGIETLRNDFSTQRNEQLLEIRTLNEVIRQSQAESTKLQVQMAELKGDNKELKAQNLQLQYHLNHWGIPVWAGQDSKVAASGVGDPAKSFFPPLSPLVPGQDPIPVTLRGDLTYIYFPDVLHFLANAHLVGVLTVASEAILSKLYVEKSVLRLAGWNNKDEELGLMTLLRESELVEVRALDRLKKRNLYDLELATALLMEEKIPSETIRPGLHEHARVILSYLFQLKRGDFFFQPGQVNVRRELQFRMPIMDLLLKTAAEVDERTRHADTTVRG